MGTEGASGTEGLQARSLLFAGRGRGQELPAGPLPTRVSTLRVLLCTTLARPRQPRGSRRRRWTVAKRQCRAQRPGEWGCCPWACQREEGCHAVRASKCVLTALPNFCFPDTCELLAGNLQIRKQFKFTHQK